MLKNKYRAREVQQQSFRVFREIMEYKCMLIGIKLITADRYFPSSKKCSQCNLIKKDLSSWDKIFKCQCGNIIDRDYQSAVNLELWGRKKVNSIY